MIIHRRLVFGIALSLLSQLSFATGTNPGPSSKQIQDLKVKLNDLQSQITAISNNTSPSRIDHNYASSSSCSATDNASCLLFVTALKTNGGMQSFENNLFNVVPPTAGGITAGDSICQQEGDIRFGTGRSWLAVLSEPNNPAGQRIFNADVSYININGTIFAPPGTLFTSDENQNFLVNVNSMGSGNSLAYTGTLYNGETGDYTCNGWTSSNAGDRANIGIPDVVNEFWISIPNQITCNNFYYLYCVEQR